jgi:hypothetical protein
MKLRLAVLKSCSICGGDYSNHDDLVIHVALEHGVVFVPEAVTASENEVVVSVPKALVGSTWHLEKVEEPGELYDLVEVKRGKL